LNHVKKNYVEIASIYFKIQKFRIFSKYIKKYIPILADYTHERVENTHGILLFQV